MIDWKKVKNKILYNSNPPGLGNYGYMEEQANRIVKYFKSLIAKEFKLVASGKVTEDLPQLKIYFINGKQINGLFKKYSGKPISIYISENKD